LAYLKISSFISANLLIHFALMLNLIIKATLKDILSRKVKENIRIIIIIPILVVITLTIRFSFINLPKHFNDNEKHIYNCSVPLTIIEHNNIFGSWFNKDSLVINISEIISYHNCFYGKKEISIPNNKISRIMLKKGAVKPVLKIEIISGNNIEIAILKNEISEISNCLKTIFPGVSFEVDIK